MNRKATAVPKPSVAANLHQSLDVEIDLTPQIALNREVTIDVIADVRDFLVRKILHARLGGDTDRVNGLASSRPANPVDIGQ
jgi:hypothetical protein